MGDNEEREATVNTNVPHATTARAAAGAPAGAVARGPLADGRRVETSPQRTQSDAPPSSPPSEGRVVAAVRTFARHWPALVVGVAVLVADSPWTAAAWFAASRLAYVGFVGASLRAAERRGVDGGGDAAWMRFSARASWLMDNDAVAFVALCLVTAGRFPAAVSWPLSIAAGAVLVVVGAGVKIWAASSLSVGSYHWRNFFLAPAPHTLSAAGPYRFLSNPMYTLGYAHAYGVAIALHSPAGLAAAASAQASILLLHALVERPHLRRLRAQTRDVRPR